VTQCPIAGDATARLIQTPVWPVVTSHIRRWGLDPVKWFKMQYWGFRDAMLQEKYLIQRSRHHNDTVLKRVDHNRKLLAMTKTGKLIVLRSHITPQLTRERYYAKPQTARWQRKEWTDDLTEWSDKSIPDLVRLAQTCRSAYQRFVYRFAHARNSATTPWLIDSFEMYCTNRAFKTSLQFERSSACSVETRETPPAGHTYTAHDTLYVTMNAFR